MTPACVKGVFRLGNYSHSVKQISKNYYFDVPDGLDGLVLPDAPLLPEEPDRPLLPDMPLLPDEPLLPVAPVSEARRSQPVANNALSIAIASTPLEVFEIAFMLIFLSIK